MKKLILILISLLLVNNTFAFTGESLNFSQSNKNKVEYQSTAVSHFLIKDIRQDPSPANPGTYLDLYFRIDNIGGDIAQPRFELLLPSQFSLDKTTITQDYPPLLAGDKITLHYKVQANKDAVPGEYEIEFRAYSEKGIYYPYFFNIKVDDVTSDFDLALQDVTKDGAAIAISNIGKNTANAITISLDNQEDFDLLGTSRYIIGNLNAGDYTIVNTLLKPKNTNQELKLKVQIDYTDIVGTRRTATKQINVMMTQQVKKGFTELENLVLTSNQPKQQGNSRVFLYTSIILLTIIIVLVLRYKRRKE